VLHTDSNPLEHMIRLARDVGPQAREQELRNFLGTFNFSGDMVNQAVGTMSGGEKARLVLAMMVWQRPNLLLLDEPTNHLDLATREALSMALNEFEGTVMLVSHDRALLRAVCDEFWLVGRGEIRPFDGDLDDYQQYLLDESRRLREVARAAAAPVRAPAAPPAAPVASPKLRPLQRDLEKTEQRMAALQTEKDSLEAQLAAETDAARIAQTGQRVADLGLQLADLEERWLDISSQIETVSG
jgi:ATP-binding cassette subfamily F protein 3